MREVITICRTWRSLTVNIVPALPLTCHVMICWSLFFVFVFLAMLYQIMTNDSWLWFICAWLYACILSEHFITLISTVRSQVIVLCHAIPNEALRFPAISSADIKRRYYFTHALNHPQHLRKQSSEVSVDLCRSMKSPELWTLHHPIFTVVVEHTSTCTIFCSGFRYY